MGKASCADAKPSYSLPCLARHSSSEHFDVISAFLQSCQSAVSFETWASLRRVRAVQGHKTNDADARDEQELFGAAGGGNALGDEFGLQLHDDDEEGGGGFDDDDEDDDMDAEEGEV